MSEAKHGEASAVSWMEMKYRHDAPHLNRDSLMNPVSVILHSLMNQVLALQLPLITQKCLRFRPRKLTRFVEKRRHRDLKSALASLSPSTHKINVSPMRKEWERRRTEIRLSGVGCVQHSESQDSQNSE